VGSLHGFDRVFGCKSTHYQGQLAVGCRLDGKPINALHVLRGMSATVHFHNKLDVFHGSFLFSVDLTKKENTNRREAIVSRLPVFALASRNRNPGNGSQWVFGFLAGNTIPSRSTMT
jgi:hypothetical protein